MPVVLYGTNVNVTDEIYGPNLPVDMFYPKVINYPYPKPGRANPVVTLWVADLSSPMVGTPKQVTPPKEIQEWEYYITAVQWINNSKISVLWTKRSQNITILTACAESDGWKCEKLFEEQLHATKGWLEINEAPHFSEDGSRYFMKLPVADGARGTYDHIAMITVDLYSLSQKYFLTHGQFTVIKILAYRSDHNKVYYVATSIGQPGERNVYSVTDITDPNPRKIECLSCEASNDCKYYDALFSPTKKYYILECLGPITPRTELRRVENNELIAVLNTYPHYDERNEQKAMPKIRYMNVPLSNNHFARVKLILPQSLEEDENAKYPVVVEV
ncbi:prolyl endopeptidase FAP-like protein [Dinothrombium tinctorium]|nr:prolyl endopeptidase FAP-like protein [Dinothrombium tinctorium]